MHVAVLLSYTHIGTYGHCVFLTLTWHSWDNCVGKFQEYGAWLMQGFLLARLCMTFFVGPLLRPSVPLEPSPVLGAFFFSPESLPFSLPPSFFQKNSHRREEDQAPPSSLLGTF
ncbi:hypothetical protein VNO77_27131 [Canavalia gladiata]|uniref:Uncharacterized protein n=1 Tax=Canavalia gladiata TaxID=3824 RepID=A0AAN9KYA0_CANGL